MAHHPLHNYFVFNEELQPNSRFNASEIVGGIYEVLRVENGVPLFVEDHLERFYRSAAIAVIPVPFENDDIAGFLHALVRKNKVFTGNILLSCKENLNAFFIPHKYPEPQWYETGVPCGVLKAERENPNAKVFQTPVRQLADEMMAQQDLYEVVLVDHQNRVTEGSRSNFFFIEGDVLVTPPGKAVLLGITRQKTIFLAKESGIQVVEKDVHLDNLSDFHAAFITGTSPKILPVSRIGDCSFEPRDPLVRNLMKKYDELISGYINKVRQNS